MKIKNPINSLANFLMISGILLLIYIYAPYLSLYLPHTTSTVTVDTAYYINIPKINASAPIIENVDPWNKANYEAPLKRGIAEASGFSTVGQPGTTFLFAHSSLPPWAMTRSNTSFLRLGELQNGDQFTVYKNGQQYKYEVFDKKEVWPNQVSSLLESKDQAQLILQTCTPIGTDLKRLLIYSKPVS